MSISLPFPGVAIFGVLAILVLGASAVAAPAQPGGTLFTGFQSKSKDPIQIDASSLEISEDGKQRIAVFDGNVTVKRGDTTMTAAKMIIYSDKDSGSDPKNEAFTRIEATGGVRVSSGPQMLTGEMAVIDMKTHIITLSGGVVLTQGSNVITGERLILDTTTGKARIEQAAGKPIRGIFAPTAAKPGAGDTAPTPATPAPAAQQ
jgi:lipopolysaccharide export system protein LptA